MKPALALFLLAAVPAIAQEATNYDTMTCADLLALDDAAQTDGMACDGPFHVVPGTLRGEYVIEDDRQDDALFEKELEHRVHDPVEAGYGAGF